jgi:hypothetical protein
MLRRYGLWPILIFGWPAMLLGTIMSRYHPWSLVVVMVLFVLTPLFIAWTRSEPPG